MKKIVFVYALVATVAAWGSAWLAADRCGEVRRLSENARVLTDSLYRYRTRLDESAASVGVLQLRCGEYAERHAADVRTIRELGIRLRRVESAAKTALETRVETAAAIRDTVTADADSVRCFAWSDGWVTVEGRIRADSAECSVKSVDTLRQIVHRVPRRFLFIRYGTKAVRQEIVSSNPHSEVVFAEYVELPARRRRK